MEALCGSIEDSKSAYTGVRFLLLSAVRFNVGKDVFAIELQQLGLPREHSQNLGKILDEHSTSLREHLRSKSLTINKLVDVQVKESHDMDCVRMEMEIQNTMPHNRTVKEVININKADIPILLNELKIIREQLECEK